MQAKDVMTQPVISVRPDTTVSHAIQTMLQKKISGLPVIDRAGRLVGLVTEGDFLRRVETSTQRQRPRWLELLVGPGRLANEYTHTHGRKVAEVMTASPITADETAPLDEIVALMEKRRIKRVPITRKGKVVGIVSRANLLRALARMSAKARPLAGDDEDIRAAIVAEFKLQKWAPAVSLDVVVRDGIVGLWGTITDERERQALIVAAENVAGVKAVHDHLTWIDVTSGVVFPSPEDLAEQQTARADETARQAS